jgi:drug/metabolite transporter (DMT)-like permease
MSLPAIALVLLAAVVHAGWNLLVKQVDDDREAITWLALSVGSVMLAAWVVGGDAIGGGHYASWRHVAAVWPLVLASAVAEAAYILLLAAAYKLGDLSVVYPIARGTAPLLLAVWTTLFVGQTPALGGWAGMIVLASGVVLVAGSAHRHGSDTGVSAAFHRPGTAIAVTLGVALCISAYSVVDGAAMRRTAPTPYEAVVFALGALFIAPLVVQRLGWDGLRQLCARRWQRITLVGAAMAGAYAAVLVAFRLAPIAYVGATREVSIVFAALAGWRFLNEPLGARRFLGACLTVLGGAAIALSG